jgi:hypothetical protein
MKWRSAEVRIFRHFLYKERGERKGILIQSVPKLLSHLPHLSL